MRVSVRGAKRRPWKPHRQQHGDSGCDRHRRHETDRAHQRADDLLRDRVGVDGLAERGAGDAEQQDDRQGGAEVREDERVDGRGDVVASDRQRLAEERERRHAFVRPAEGHDRRRLAHRDVVQDPERSDDEAGEEEALERQTLLAGEEHRGRVGGQAAQVRGGSEG